MARQKGTCAYCATAEVLVEEEHVFPNSWYPTGTVGDSKMRVPSCRACNAGYCQIEQRMFFPLVCGLPLDDRGMRDIVERALRGMNASVAGSRKDAKHRAARLRSIQRRVRVLASESDLSTAVWSPQPRTIVPLQTAAGLHVRGTPAIEFNADDLSALGVKFMKGTYYSLRGMPLPAEMVCDARAFSRDPSEAMRHAQQLRMNPGGRPPPFEFMFAYAAEDHATTMWLFRLWEHYVITASSMRPEMHERIEARTGSGSS